MLGALILVAALTSQPPAPSLRPAQSDPQSLTTGPHYRADADRRGTEQMPFVVKVKTTPNADKEAENAAAYRKDEAADNRWLLIVTGILALIAAVQAGFFLWQLHYMRQGVQDASKAASASTKQATITQQTFESVERPYVFIYGIEWNESEPAEDENTSPDEIYPYFRYFISSDGKLPAVMDFIGININIGNTHLPSMELKPWPDNKTKIMRPGIIEKRTGAPNEREYEGDSLYAMGEYGPLLRVPNLPKDCSVFVEILIQYHGPFTKGHESRVSWWYSSLNEGEFSEYSDPRRTYMT